MSFGSSVVRAWVRKVHLMMPLWAVLGMALASQARAQVTLIQNISPQPNELAVSPSAEVQVTYNNNIDFGTVNAATVSLYGRYSGRLAASYGGTGPTIIVTPNLSFFPGSRISVTITDGIKNIGGDPGRPFAWSFTTDVLGGNSLYDSGQTLSNQLSYAVALGDLDADGDLDAFVAHSGTDHAVYLNNGSGVLTDSGWVLANTGLATGVALGDMDGDGLVDAVVSVSGAANQLWFGSGSGFSLSSFGSTEKSTDVALADLDNDGDLDAFVTNDEPLLYGDRVWVNDGAGVLSQQTYDPAPLGGPTYAIELGSGNANYCSDPPGALRSVTTPYNRSDAVALGDINGDGWIDAVVADLGRTATVWLNYSGKMFGDCPSPQNPFTASFPSSQGQGVALGDIDGDGDLDLFIARGGLTSRANMLWLNNGSGTFTNTLQNLGSKDSYDVELADIDADGDLDAVVANSDFTATNSSNDVWINNGSGNFGLTPLQTMIGAGKNYEQTYGLDLGDLDNDGDLDAVFANIGVFPFNTDGVWLNNTSPVVSVNTGASVDEGSTVTISTARLAFTDVDDVDTALTYTMTVIPVNGTLERSAVNLGVGSQFTQADINSNVVVYRHNGSETTGDLFKFRVADPRGAQTTENTFNVTVIAVNDVPQVGVNQGLTVAEGGTATITNTMLRATDADHPDPAVLTFTVTGPPPLGAVLRQGSPTTTFTQDDINNNRVSYRHDGGEAASDAFTFTVRDNGTPPGVTAPQVFNVTVTPVNDPPTVAVNNGATVLENATVIITSAMLQAADPDNTANELSFVVQQVPVNGDLFNGSDKLSQSGTFTQADVNTNKITYVHSGSETLTDSFRFTIRDFGGQTAPAETFAIVVTPVNDAPVVTVNSGLSVAEGGTATIGQSRLLTTDVDIPAQTLTYTITQLPTNGTLRIGSTAILLNGTFTQAEINANSFNYQHNGSATSSDSFRFRVADNGTPTMQTAETIFGISVGAVNDPPQITLNTGASLAEGAAVFLTGAMLDSTDQEDDLAGIPLTYTLLTLPTRGTLRDGQQNLIVGSTFVQTKLDSGNVISYEHNGSETVSDSFQVVVKDSQGLSSGSATFVITITAVNDVPRVVANLGLTLGEGATSTITSTALRATDDDNNDADLIYTVSQIPAYGALQRDTTTLAINGTFTQGDVDTGKVTYVHNGTENFADAFHFTVRDTATPTYGETASQTFAITITAINDAPVMVANNGLVLDEGSQAIITDADLAASDVDNLPSTLVYVVLQAPLNGTLRNGNTALTTNSTFTQGHINAGNINYLHSGSETLIDTFLFVVRDAGGASAPSGTFNITIMAVDDPPVIVRSLGLTLAEGALAAVLNTSLQTTDADNTPTELSYRLTAVPLNGSLTSNAAPLVINDSFTQQEVDDGVVAYQHDGGETLSDSFRYRVTDGFNTSTERSYAFTVTAVNDTPDIGINSGLTVSQGGTAPITNTLLAATDQDNIDSSLQYRLITAPVNGTLRVGSTALAVNGTFLQSDIDAGNLTYENTNIVATTDTFRISVTDGTATSPAVNFNIVLSDTNFPPSVVNNNPATVLEGGTLVVGPSLLSHTDVDNDDATLVYTVTVAPVNGILYRNVTPLGMNDVFTQDQVNRGRVTYVHSGSETTADSFTFTVEDNSGVPIAPADFIISVTPVNDLPVQVNNNLLTLDEGATATITTALLSYSDVEQAASSLTYRLLLAPSNGTLLLGSTPILTNGTFTQAQINQNALRYMHSGSETSDDSFSFVVTDGFDTTSDELFLIVVNPVNDAPVITRHTVTFVTEGLTEIVDNSTLRATDADDDDALLRFTLTVPPSHGQLLLTGAPLAVNDTFTQGDVNALSLVITNDGGEASSDSFSVVVRDPSNAVYPSSGSQVMSVTIRAVNDPPVVVANTGATVVAGQNVTITSSMLRATDADDSNASLIYTITQVPQHGRLRNNITNVQAGSRVLQSEIDANRLVYIHGGDEAIADSFGFRVKDPNNSELAEMFFDITINAVNDPPRVVQNTGRTIEEGAPFTLNATLLSATDPDNDDTALVFTLQVPPTHGSLLLVSTAVATNGTFTQGDIDAGRMSYQHDGSESSSDSFTFVVSDPLGASSASTVFAIVVNPVNDMPTIINNGLTVNEGARMVIPTTALSAQDVDSDVPSLVYTLVSAPIHGTLFAGLAPVTPGNTFSQNTISTSNLAYLNDGAEFASDSFVFRVRDSGNAETVNTTFTITIFPVNDAPVVGTIPDQTVMTGASFTSFDLDDFVTDVDNTASELTWSVSGNSNLNVTISATNVVNLVEASTGWVGAEVLTFTVDDGTDTASAAATFTITATPNQAPNFVDPTPAGVLTVEVGQELAFTVLAEDPDGDTLTYGAQVLPIGATFSTTSGAFQWFPLTQHIGSWPVTLTAQDLDHTASRAIVIDVVAAPVADAGVVDAGPPVEEGCGCSAPARGGRGVLAVLVVLGLVLRRRRQS
ncbi:MAG: cadherin-like domain-containing protein [Pseudomonadota bacterium]